jgi:hypothetical protein
MSAFSDYLENKLGDHILRDTAYTKPTTIYVALLTAAPSDAGGGTEVSGGSYARVQCGPSLTAWKGTHGTTTGASSGTGGVFSNAAGIAFPSPTAGWGTVTHFGLYDASTAGNLLFQGALSSSQVVNNGDPAPSFAAGALVVTLA